MRAFVDCKKGLKPQIRCLVAMGVEMTLVKYTANRHC